jgi:hypothetical protein
VLDGLKGEDSIAELCRRGAPRTAVNAAVHADRAVTARRRIVFVKSGNIGNLE